jgi:hypothetical protein
VKAKLIGKLLIVAGIVAIIAGIVAKRGLHMVESVGLFHGIGGLLLVIGASIFFLSKGEPS